MGERGERAGNFYFMLLQVATYRDDGAILQPLFFVGQESIAWPSTGSICRALSRLS